MNDEEMEKYRYLKFLESQAIAVAFDYHRGGCDFQTFQRVLARLTLQATGNPSPTLEQIEAQISELNTATSIHFGRLAGLDT
ncbi:hypothetical protein CQY20_31950 [Mycolicibacterium agri]|uniref:Uncharacterized protein n=1 Tax=Mycolicibacterium agri TaxID=36811 RepID=A0A2A7MNX8_MYCAG|nr:hypothetical protein [Mycolicibacterium agri]PEG33227.1 hypothetical protein CQY20_31950 [Mycolicibacterium agri]GFG49459.1 hypothetical protein MAGR_09000 [Mycolicibacterium agri]